MYCTECGRELSEAANFCAKCGVKIHRSESMSPNSETITKVSVGTGTTEVAGNRAWSEVVVFVFAILATVTVKVPQLFGIPIDEEFGPSAVHWCSRPLRRERIHERLTSPMRDDHINERQRCLVCSGPAGCCVADYSAGCPAN